MKPIAEFHTPAAEVKSEGEQPRAHVSETPATAAPHPVQSVSGRRTTLSVPSLSLKGSGEKSRPSAATVSRPTAIAEPRTTPFTDADIQRLWENYIAAHDSLHLLANAMRMSPPARKDATRAIFSVMHSSIQIGFIREYINDITAYVRNGALNDSIEFELIEVEEDSPLAWNDRELIKHIIHDNPAVADFAKEFQLKLI